MAHASRQLGKPVIEDRILNQILYYLPQLYELNRDLLRELEERLAQWYIYSCSLFLWKWGVSPKINVSSTNACSFIAVSSKYKHLMDYK